MELKVAIAAVRKAAGLTQEQLGELLGVTRQAVSKWESGQTSPDVATLAALCEKLRVSADYVLLGKEPEEQGTAASAPVQRCPLCGEAVFGNACPQCGYVPGLSREDLTDGRTLCSPPRRPFRRRTMRRTCCATAASRGKKGADCCKQQRTPDSAPYSAAG